MRTVLEGSVSISAAWLTGGPSRPSGPLAPGAPNGPGGPIQGGSGQGWSGEGSQTVKQSNSQTSKVKGQRLVHAAGRPMQEIVGTIMCVCVHRDGCIILYTLVKCDA